MNSCESQSTNQHLEKDDNSSQSYSTNEPPLRNNQPQAMTLEYIEGVIENGGDSEFQALLTPLSIVINQSDYQRLYLNKNLHYRLMKYFYRTFKGMNDENEENQLQLIFIMSLMAEISRKSEKIKLPFTRKIVLAMLSFDENCLKESAYGPQIIKILAVLLENLTKQGKAAVKFGVESQLKNGLLLLISRVDELFTLQILLRTIKNLLLTTNLNITKEQIQNHGVITGLINNFGDLLAAKLKVHLCRLSSQKSIHIQGKTLKDLIDN